MKDYLDIRNIPNCYWWDAQSKFESLVKQENVLKEITIQVTDKCNLNCPKCNKKNFTFEDMPVDKVIQIIDEACELGLKHIHFTGGEPTLHPDFVEIVMHCKQKNLRVDMSSNGTFNREMFYRLEKAGIDSINISWDFIYQKPRCIDFVKDTLKVDIFLNHMVMPSNFIHLPSFLLLVKVQHPFVKDIQLMPPRGTAEKFNRDQVRFYNRHIKMQAHEICSRFPMARNKVLTLLADNPIRGIYHEKIKWPCHRSKSELRVGTKGFVTCTYLYRDGHITCGLDKSVKEAWEMCKEESRGSPPVKSMCDFSCSPEVCYFNRNVEIELVKR